MQALANEMKGFIDQHAPALRSLPENELLFKSSPSKWSKKQIIGHCIDSAQSNIRRFVVAQYEDSPFITYNQDKWVSIVNYQEWDTGDLVNLWYMLNKQVCNILENMSPEMAQRKCQTEALHTIKWLAVDYFKHLRHHVHQVLELEPVTYP